MSATLVTFVGGGAVSPRSCFLQPVAARLANNKQIKLECVMFRSRVMESPHGQPQDSVGWPPLDRRRSVVDKPIARSDTRSAHSERQSGKPRHADTKRSPYPAPAWIDPDIWPCMA